MRLPRFLALAAVLSLAACGTSAPAEAPSSVTGTSTPPAQSVTAVPSIIRAVPSSLSGVSRAPVVDANTDPSSISAAPPAGDTDEAAELTKALGGLAQPLPDSDISEQVSALEYNTPPML